MFHVMELVVHMEVVCACGYVTMVQLMNTS